MSTTLSLLKAAGSTIGTVAAAIIGVGVGVGTIETCKKFGAWINNGHPLEEVVSELELAAALRKGLVSLKDIEHDLEELKGCDDKSSDRRRDCLVELRDHVRYVAAKYKIAA